MQPLFKERDSRGKESDSPGTHHKKALLIPPGLSREIRPLGLLRPGLLQSPTRSATTELYDYTGTGHGKRQTDPRKQTARLGIKQATGKYDEARWAVKEDARPWGRGFAIAVRRRRQAFARP